MGRIQWKTSWAGVHSSACSNDCWCLSVIGNTFFFHCSKTLAVLHWQCALKAGGGWCKSGCTKRVSGFPGPALCSLCRTRSWMLLFLGATLILMPKRRWGECTECFRSIKKAAVKWRFFWRGWMLRWSWALYQCLEAKPVLGWTLVPSSPWRVLLYHGRDCEPGLSCW